MRFLSLYLQIWILIFALGLTFATPAHSEDVQRFNGQYKLLKVFGYSKHFVPINCIPLIITGMSSKDARSSTCDYLEEIQEPSNRCPNNLFIAASKAPELILISQYSGISYSNSWIKLPDKNGITDACEGENFASCQLLVKKAKNYARRVNVSSANLASQEITNAAYNKSYISIQKESSGLVLRQKSIEYWANGEETQDVMNDYDVSCIYEKMN